MTSTWENIADFLGAVPDLRGAECVGQGPLFDWFDDADIHETKASKTYRHRAALALCDQCPVLTKCRAWADTLPDGDVTGVVAGEIRPPQFRVQHRGRITEQVAS